MQLKMFELADSTIEYYEKRQKYYRYIQVELEEVFNEIIKEEQINALVAIHSRIKSSDSLREKMIRNQFYQFCRTPEDVLDNLSDLIGITLQCRFIRNEEELYNLLYKHVENTGEVFSRFVKHPEIFINLTVDQPQKQRNGFEIYRIDGYYISENEKVNFELQIKSLVHNFWSEIEHEVVYKNPYFMMYDRFNRAMLGAIRDNLDIVDHQLEIMYNEITRESTSTVIGMDEQGFKMLVAKSVNELVNRKMKDSLGFVSDFKKCSAMIAQFVFIRDVLNNDQSQIRMLEYLQILNTLKEEEIDFKQEISLGRPYSFDDPFMSIIGKYFERKLNTDFQWHVFFSMLFLIQPGNNLEDFVDFVYVIKNLLIFRSWFSKKFEGYTEAERNYVRDKLQVTLANALCDADTIMIVHEDKLLACSRVFCEKVESIENSHEKFSTLIADLDRECEDLYKEIRMIFY